MRGRKAIASSAAISTLVLAGGIAFAGGAGFDPPVPYDTPNRPIDVAIGKINGDSVKDIAVATRDGDSVSVFIGEGTGAFADAINFDFNVSIYSVAIARLNDDTRPDVIASGPDQIIVLPGKAGGFSQPKMYTVDGVRDHLTDLAVADLDGDGRKDVVVGDDDADRGFVHVLYGTSNGLAEAGPLRLKLGELYGAEITDVAISDVDEDGERDVVVCPYRGFAGLWVFYGRGDRTFKTARYSAGNHALSALDIGDVDRDGRLDLVTLGDDGTAIVLRGRSTRGFRPFQEYPSGGAGSSVALGNFNDDQALDIVGADFSGNQIEVLLGEPGGFGAPQAFPFQADVIALASAQLDGVDGDDVVTALFDVSRINVILSDFP